MIFFKCQRDAITIVTVIFYIPFSGFFGFIEVAHFPLNFVVHEVIKVTVEHYNACGKNRDRNLTLGPFETIIGKASRDGKWLRNCNFVSLSR